MTKNRSVKVDDWKSLVKLVEDINPYKQTIILSGWLQEPVNGRIHIRELVFTTRSVNVLKGDSDDKGKRNRKTILA